MLTAGQHRNGLHRSLALATAVVFVLSSAFPTVAAFVRDTESWPKWWGRLDIGLALILAVLVLMIQAFTRGKVNLQAELASYHIYRILTHGILVMLVVFFLAGDRVIWRQCLTGFAWRTWVLLYALPSWFTALKTSASCPAT